MKYQQEALDIIEDFHRLDTRREIADIILVEWTKQSRFELMEEAEERP